MFLTLYNLKELHIPTLPFVSTQFKEDTLAEQISKMTNCSRYDINHSTTNEVSCFEVTENYEKNERRTSYSRRIGRQFHIVAIARSQRESKLWRSPADASFDCNLVLSKREIDTYLCP